MVLLPLFMTATLLAVHNLQEKHAVWQIAQEIRS